MEMKAVMNRDERASKAPTPGFSLDEMSLLFSATKRLSSQMQPHRRYKEGGILA